MSAFSFAVGTAVDKIGPVCEDRADLRFRYVSSGRGWVEYSSSSTPTRKDTTMKDITGITLTELRTDRGRKFAYLALVNALTFVPALDRVCSVSTGLEVQGYYHNGNEGNVYYRLVGPKGTTRTGYRTAQGILDDLRFGRFDLNTGEWIGGAE